MKQQTKKLRIKPSMKEKRRYFIIQANNKEVEQTILEYLGILGLAKAAYQEVQEKLPANKMIGSCNTKALNDIRAALAQKNIRIEKVSGTIKGLLS